YANNAWLQELPRPLSTFTWDNAALIAPATARELALQSGDVVMLEAAGAEVQAPVWVLPGHAERCVTLPLGCGRAAAGQVGDAVGFDAYRLRTGATAKVAPVALTRTDLRHVFALRQEHDRMEGRGLVRHATLGEFRRVPRFATDEA